MAKRTYQQKIIRNYYEHRGDISVQNLGEVVSELYLCTEDRRRTQLWRRAETALKGMKIAPAEMTRIVNTRDLGALAKLISREF